MNSWLFWCFAFVVLDLVCPLIGQKKPPMSSLVSSLLPQTLVEVFVFRQFHLSVDVIQWRRQGLRIAWPKVVW